MSPNQTSARHAARQQGEQFKEGESPRLPEEDRELLIAGLAKGKPNIAQIGIRSDARVPLPKLRSLDGNIPTTRDFLAAVVHSVNGTIHYVPL